MSDFCLWCFKRHRDGTKIKQKHSKLLQKVRQGHVPCNLGQCNPYLCQHLARIMRAGLRELDTNCNHLLAELNTLDHYQDLLRALGAESHQT